MAWVTVVGIIVILLSFKDCLASRESECTEVGYARAAGTFMNQGFSKAKETMLQRWAQEDATGWPTYAAFPPQIKNMSRAGQLLEEASKEIIKLIKTTRVGKRCQEGWLLKGIEKHVLPIMNLDKQLSDDLGLVISFRCLMGSPYPHVDGSCVNQQSPDFGAIGSKFLRLQPATAGPDGFLLKGSVSSDKTLPSARSVANVLREHLKKPAMVGLYSEWSHFVQRDTFSIPESPLAEGVDCCANEDAEDCASIAVLDSDPLHEKLPCINYKRSVRAQAILGHRESLSLVSTYLDATPVYGATNELAFKRKAGYFGHLKTPEVSENSVDSDAGKKESKKQQTECKAPASFQGCFPSAKEQGFAEGLSLLFSLEHNRVADMLADINAHFDDALLYNEARRLVIAEYNKVTYGEFLPLLVGEETTEKHGLRPGSEGPGAQFIGEVNPGILTAFAVAAYRNPSMATEWKEDLGVTDLFDSAQYDSVRSDSYQDVLAIDIQKGRDHGVPGYAVWRSFCDNGVQLHTWEDVEKIFPKKLAIDLKELYNGEIQDLDMMVALLEEPLPGAVVGKTFTCILADQYARLRTGNRLYWEHETSLLTEEQKDNIRLSVTLASLLCRNLPLKFVPRNAFLPVSADNPLVPCDQVASLDSNLWKDTSLVERMKEIREAEARGIDPLAEVEKELKEDQSNSGNVLNSKKLNSAKEEL